MPKNKKVRHLLPHEKWSYETPENWIWTILGDVAQYVNGRAFRPDEWEEKGLPIIRIQNLTGTDSSYHYCSKQLEEKYKIQHGDLLFAWSASLGAHIWQHEAAWLNQHIFHVIPEEVITKKYLYYYLIHIVDVLVRKTHGSGMVHITLQPFKNTSIPLPPLPEQQRIVARIESLFAKLDAAEGRIKDALEKSERLQASVLHLAFTGELTKKWREYHSVGLDSWIPSTSTDLFEYVTSGSRGWAQYYSDSGAVFIRMGNLEHGTIELNMTDTQYVNLPDKVEGQRSLVQKGDILISITADVGMIGLVRDIDFEGYINQHIALARPTDKDSAEFIAWYLVSDVGLSQLRKKQRGATKVGLGLNDIRGIILNIPSKDEQREIVRILNTVFDTQRRAKEIAEKSLSRIADMKKSMLALAFRGQLGTNNLREESMERLLMQEVK